MDVQEERIALQASMDNKIPFVVRGLLPVWLKDECLIV